MKLRRQSHQSLCSALGKVLQIQHQFQNQHSPLWPLLIPPPTPTPPPPPPLRPPPVFLAAAVAPPLPCPLPPLLSPVPLCSVSQAPPPPLTLLRPKPSCSGRPRTLSRPRPQVPPQLQLSPLFSAPLPPPLPLPLLLLLLRHSTLAQQRLLLPPLQLPQLLPLRLSSALPPPVDLGRTRPPRSAPRSGLRSRVSPLSPRPSEQNPTQHQPSDRPTPHPCLERLLTPHQQVEVFSSVEPVLLGPLTVGMVCSRLGRGQGLLLRPLLPPLPLSPEQPPQGSTSPRDLLSTLGQINLSRHLLVDKRSPGAGSRRPCGAESRGLDLNLKVWTWTKT